MFKLYCPDINGAFRFHNVGQRLFYSGILNNQKCGTFSFVYDCGTVSPLSFIRRKIDDFKLLLPAGRKDGNKRIDLLVISHLHDDHVSGLAELLDGVEIDTVVMPYMHEKLRLMFF